MKFEKYFSEFLEFLDGSLENSDLLVKKIKVHQEQLGVVFPASLYKYFILSLNDLSEPEVPLFSLDEIYMDHDCLVFQEDLVEFGLWGIKFDGSDDPLVYLKDDTTENNWISYDILFSDHIMQQLEGPLFKNIFKKKLEYFSELLDFPTEFLFEGQPPVLGKEYPSPDWIKNFPTDYWIEEINQKEKELGIIFPKTFREYLTYELYGIFMSSDPLYGLDKLELQSDMLLFQIENQGVCIWAIKIDGSEDPPLYVAENNDEYNWEKCNINFVDYIIQLRIELFDIEQDCWIQAYDVNLDESQFTKLENKYKRLESEENYNLYYNRNQTISIGQLPHDVSQKKYFISIGSSSPKILEIAFNSVIDLFPHLKEKFVVRRFIGNEFGFNKLYNP